MQSDTVTHIRLHPNNINRDSGIAVPEAWIPTTRKHNSRPTAKWTCEGTTANSRGIISYTTMNNRHIFNEKC